MLKVKTDDYGANEDCDILLTKTSLKCINSLVVCSHYIKKKNPKTNKLVFPLAHTDTHTHMNIFKTYLSLMWVAVAVEAARDTH